jgi:hypothetical protein
MFRPTSAKGAISFKTLVIVLVIVAVILGGIAYAVIFGIGTQVVQPQTATTTAANASSSTATFVFPSSTLSSSSATGIAGASTTASGTDSFASTFSAPYPVSWTDGQSSFAISGATMVGNELTLFVNITLGNLPECVPINLRLISDEEGDTAAPTSPDQTNFPLSSSTCQGDANAVYQNQALTFTVDPAASPFLFLTGGTSNVYFEVSTTTDGGVDVAIPQQSG